MKTWIELDDKAKKDILAKEHINGSMSINRIAEKYVTYPNKIFRDARRLGIKVDNKSAAQKKVLKFGVAEHPTAGKERTAQEKSSIAKSRREAWDNLSDKDRKSEVKRLRKMYKDQKVKMHENPKKMEKIREAAKTGSKLEKYVFQKLKEKYTSVAHQKEDVFTGQSFHIDIFMAPNIAIEIDGPAHFEAIWGEDKLQETKQKDFRKHAACLAKGYYFISVINDKSFTIVYGDQIVAKLIPILDKIQESGYLKKKILCRVDNE